MTKDCTPCRGYSLKCQPSGRLYHCGASISCLCGEGDTCFLNELRAAEECLIQPCKLNTPVTAAVRPLALSLKQRKHCLQRALFQGLVVAKMEADRLLHGCVPSDSIKDRHNGGRSGRCLLLAVGRGGQRRNADRQIALYCLYHHCIDNVGFIVAARLYR